MNFSDSETISLIRKGNKLAFEKLFLSYYSRLCEYSYTICKDKETSVEIVQDFFVRLWDNRSNLNISSVKAYLFRSIHNNTIKCITRKSATINIDSIQECGSESIPDFELSETLERSIAELPPRCREVFVLSRMDKLRHKEIASMLGISERTVEVQIRKAGQILKEKMKEFLSIFW